MTVKNFGIALMVGGLTMVAVGVIGYFGSTAVEGADREPAVNTTTTATSPATTTSLITTTTSPPTTTMTLEEAETVEEFVLLFAAALEERDFDFVWQRLHPEVVEIGGEDLCRAWVESEIMALSDYTLHEVTGGPETVNGIPDVYSAAVSFTYQGQVFDDGSGQYALVDGTFRWLGVCR